MATTTAQTLTCPCCARCCPADDLPGTVTLTFTTGCGDVIVVPLTQDAPGANVWTETVAFGGSALRLSCVPGSGYNLSLVPNGGVSNVDICRNAAGGFLNDFPVAADTCSPLSLTFTGVFVGRDCCTCAVENPDCAATVVVTEP